MAVSVQELAYGFEGGLGMFLGTREMLSELVELLPLHIIVGGDQLSRFPAAADPPKEVSASCAQLWQETSLLDKTWRDCGGTNLDQIVVARGVCNVPPRMLNLADENTNISNCGGRSARRLSLSHLCTKLCSFAVLPPWDGNCCADTDNRKDGLNPRRLHLRFERTPPNQLAIHAAPFVVWGEA